MKRLLAFFLALLLALTSAVGLHFLAESRIHVDSNAFASWSGDGKFQAREAILQNLTEDTILTFGSSEFQHGVKTPYHPAKVFQNTKFQMMLNGAGFYQSVTPSHWRLWGMRYRKKRRSCFCHLSGFAKVVFSLKLLRPGSLTPTILQC